MNRFIVPVVLCALVMMAAAPSPAAAQSNAEVNAGIQFDFSLPGARSLAMGGAFVPLADDATAAWANPAGLLVLTKPEVSAEFRSWSFSNFITDRGHGFGSPSGIGVDNIAGLLDSESEDNTGGVAFMSFVYPKPRWAFAAYRHQLSDFEANVTSSGPFLDSGSDIDRVDPFLGSLDLNIVNYGFSFGARLSEHLTLGAGLGIHDFSINSVTDWFLYVPLGPPAPPLRGSFVGSGQRFGPADLSASNVLFTNDQHGDDVALAVNVGALYRADKWSFGAAFRQGPNFNFSSTLTAGPASPRATPTGGAFAVGQVLDEEDLVFAVPDVYAVGVAMRPSDTFVISVEYDRVQYSQISDNNREVLGIEENNPGVGPTLGRLINENLQFPDSNQLRAGAEYSWVLSQSTVLLRFGTWFDPDHRMRFESNDPLVRRLSVLYRPGEDEMHFAPGVGFAVGKFQVDAALDFSERINTVAVSTVYRF